MAPPKGISSKGGRRGRGTWQISAEIDPPISQLIRQFDGLRDGLRDMRPAWDMLIPQLRLEMGRHFMSRGAATGTPWEVYGMHYARRRKGGAMLVLSGKLLDTLTTKGVLWKSRRTLRFGVRLPYARAVNFGSRNQGIAKRKYMMATPRIRELASSAVNAQVDRVLSGFGLQRGRMLGNTVLRRKSA